MRKSGPFALACALLMVAASAKAQSTTLLKPDAVYDGVTDRPHPGWAVLVSGDTIARVGPASQLVAGAAEVVSLPGGTLMAGMMEGHSHRLREPNN
jgi:cytosine/adenosine deaminase-related metal-dependent hydrolase